MALGRVLEELRLLNKLSSSRRASSSIGRWAWTSRLTRWKVAGWCTTTSSCPSGLAAVRTPRIVQRILQDKPSQLAIGVFVATFAHAMLTLREVQTDPRGAVPGLAVVLAFVLVVVSIIVLVWYVNHIGRKLRVSALIKLVGSDTCKLLDTLLSRGRRGATLRTAVDIAERSVADSPFLDPTTAVQAIDRLHDCLRQLAIRAASVDIEDIPTLSLALRVGAA